MRTLKCKIYI